MRPALDEEQFLFGVVEPAVKAAVVEAAAVGLALERGLADRFTDGVKDVYELVHERKVSRALLSERYSESRRPR